MNGNHKSVHKKQASLVPLNYDFTDSSEFEPITDLIIDASAGRQPPAVLSRTAVSRSKTPDNTSSPCDCSAPLTLSRTGSPGIIHSINPQGMTHSASFTANNGALGNNNTANSNSPSRLASEGVRLAVDGHQATASITQEGLKWTYESTKCCMPSVHAEAIPFSEVLSAKVCPPLMTKIWNPFPEKMYRLMIYTFQRSNSNAAHWVPRRIVLSSPSEGILHQWAGQINLAAATQPRRPRHLLVVVNPYGGKRKAPKVYESAVVPVFDRAGIKTTMQLTQFRGHGHSLIIDMSLTEFKSYDGIVAVGGDGLFHEVINGLLEVRALGDERSSIASTYRVGHIPAGSTDAVACTLHGTRNPFTAAMHIALGDGIPLDVLRIDFADGRKEYAASMTSYGFFGDVMAEGEKMRWLGPMRYDVVGAKMLFANRSYHCRVSYLPAEREQAHSFKRVCSTRCDLCVNPSSGNSTSNINNNSSSSNLASMMNGTTPTMHHSQRALSVRREDWKSVEGQFATIMLVIMPCRSDKTLNGVARYGHLSDGNIHLVLVKKCSRLQYFTFLMSLTHNGLEAGIHENGHIEVIPITSVKVESMGGPESHWNVDGELVDCTGLTAETHRGAIEVFARGVEV